MKRAVIFLMLGLTPLLIVAQNPNGSYNPFVDGGTISPAPLLAIESEGKGMLSFNLGNNGADPLKVYSDQYLILTVTLSYGIPDNEDPLLSISGSYAGYFSWSYDTETNTYTAVQVTEIPALSEGDIEIAFKVVKNSNSPGVNGFNVNITPSPYQTASNNQNDDAVSSYTYTETATSLDQSRNSQISIFPNPSEGEFMIDLKGFSGDFIIDIIASNGTVVKQDIVNLKGTPVNLILNDYIPGLYQIHLYNEAHSYRCKLILE